ncbi:MAG: YbaY family lipoprotein [Spirochaetota bacterium]
MRNLTLLAALTAIFLVMLSACATTSGSSSDNRGNYLPITGSIELSQSLLLKSEISVELELLELSREKDDHELIAKQIIKNPKRFPIQFSLRYDSDDIRTFNTYVVRMKTFEGDRLIYESPEDQPVLTQGNPDTITIESVPVN